MNEYLERGKSIKITGVFNEEKNIARTIEAVLKQGDTQSGNDSVDECVGGLSNECDLQGFSHD